ncbi:HesA/MoeB/ThiF family protein [Fluviispira vulneris]|uniref:HesA/MoeB/ThiF family protein n=1 Tax=Fluviispira vulneris TaxID=2763012 RepID=UPI0016481FCB|nr:ThiF family adenylyltransferase [Fluviispira vulneris]
MSILKFKNTIEVFYKDNIISFVSSGSSIEVEDNQGILKFLCDHISKSIKIDEFEKITKNSPYSIECINDALNLLDENLLLETENRSFYNLTDNDILRFSRNFDFFNSFITKNDSKYLYQDKLKKSKVALLGVGGLGSHILYDLVALGVHNITAVDFDVVELSNLNRQILYREKDIGQRKIKAAEKNILEFNKNININFIDTKLDSSSKISSIIKNHDIVICVADKPRFEIPYWLNEACLQENIPFINGGISVQQASFYSVIPYKSGCVECWKKESIKKGLSLQSTLQNNQKIYESEFPAPAFVPLVSILTGMMLSEFTKIITGISKPISLNNYLSFHFQTLKIDVIESWERNIDCNLCGNNKV